MHTLASLRAPPNRVGAMCAMVLLAESRPVIISAASACMSELDLKLAETCNTRRQAGDAVASEQHGLERRTTSPHSCGWVVIMLLLKSTRLCSAHAAISPCRTGLSLFRRRIVKLSSMTITFM